MSALSFPALKGGVCRANLIKLYTNPPHKVGEPQKSNELAKAFLGDYTYICEWSDQLVFIRIAAAIKNKKFGIYSVGNYTRFKLKEFNEADSSESLQRMSTR